MIEFIFKLAVVAQGTAIALGVGASTIVLASFLAALSDNKIDQSERNLLGVIYWTLRFAMVYILATTAIVYFVDPSFFGAFNAYLWYLIAVLYINALAMTKHWISSKYGPAIQAGTWYTLGFMLSVHTFNLFSVGWGEFITLHVVDICIAWVLVNGWLWWVKRG